MTTIKTSVNIPPEKGEDKDTIRQAVANKLKVKIDGLEILKKSLDARDKKKIFYAYTVAAETSQTDKALKNGGTIYVRQRNYLSDITADLRYEGGRPIVIGAGPCGLFAALTLAETGAKPIILERGDRVEERKKKSRSLQYRPNFRYRKQYSVRRRGRGYFLRRKAQHGNKQRLRPRRT